MLVGDTSMYINGRRDHLPPDTFPSVWSLIEAAIADGRIIVPREVYRELRAQDDEVAAWIHELEQSVVEPSQEVQRRAGEFLAEFPSPGVRNQADPFILAEAEIRSFTVVTYEGRTFSGVPTRRWARTMPGVCQRFGIECCTLPEALGRLGAQI